MTNANNQFLEMAYAIGIKICRDAIWSGNKCNWVGPSMEHMDNSWKVVFRAYGTDLYSGTCGIGHFLSHLYAHTNDPIIKKTALGSFTQASRNKEQVSPSVRIGFYTGWAGMLKTMQSCSTLLGTREFDKEILQMTTAIHNADIANGGIDVLAGCAGAIPVLMEDESSLKARSIEKAMEIGNYLIKIAFKNEKGWSWNTLNPTSLEYANNLTGFSHGTAGIGWAFMELFNVTNEARYYEAAQRAFDYERALFNAQYGNWPDLRNNAGSQELSGQFGSLAWCHGAPGIGLSRLRAFELTGDDMYKKEAEIAIDSTQKMLAQSLNSSMANYSLCHGIAGNAELLIMTAATLGKQEHVNFAEQVGTVGIHAHLNSSNPWPCGIMGAGEVPGLMLGTAGIGYFYLRLHHSAQVPSILIPFAKKRLDVSLNERNKMAIAS